MGSYPKYLPLLTFVGDIWVQYEHTVMQDLQLRKLPSGYTVPLTLSPLFEIACACQVVVALPNLTISALDEVYFYQLQIVQLEVRATLFQNYRRHTW